MLISRIFKWLLAVTAVFLFIWFIVLKLVARLAVRLGHSAPCPASASWIVDNPLRRWVMQPVLDWVNIQPGEQVLELGPGPGAFTVAAARQAEPQGRLIAVDIQPEMIAQVQQRVRAAGLTNVETHVAGAYQLPLSDDSIDRAFLISVLPEIPNPTLALAELHRVLRPDGTLSITAEFADPDYLFVQETVRLCEQAGFTLVARQGNWWRYTLNFQPAQGEASNSSYYVARQKQMVREFDGVVRRIRPLFKQRYGASFIETVEAEARAEFIDLIPQLPYIGGKANPLTWNLVGTAWFLALYRAMQHQGKAIDEVGPLLREIYTAWLDAYPDWLLRLQGWYQFTPLARLRRDKNARRSQERRYPGDWVYTTLPKNGHDFGVDYSECGILKFCQAQDAAELMPYLCGLDFTMSERLGLGLERTTTLAEGGSHCDFRFTQHGSTIWPEGLKPAPKRSLTPETVALLRHPQNHEPLRYEIKEDAYGRIEEWLTAEETSERYPIKDGIPIFVQAAKLKGLNKKYRTFYQWSAPLYDFFVRLYGRFWGGSEQIWRQEFLRELEIEPGDYVLEVSVGTGGNLHFLPETTVYYGLDLTEGMLRQCQRNLRTWQRHARLFLGNAEQLPFEDESFDVVFHVGGINFFNDQQAAIEEMIRVAKPGTKIMIVDETEAGVRQYEKMPGSSLLFRSEREAARAPVELVPSAMLDVSVTPISRGAFYCLTFRKPVESEVAVGETAVATRAASTTREPSSEENLL